MAGLKSTASPAALFAGGEVGVWYDPSDLTTLFQDSAGTTPVTAAGQPVGLMLDKSKGLTVGPEILVNGDFSQGSTGWSVGTGWSISGGVATHTGALGIVVSTPPTAFTTGLSYLIEFDYSGSSTPFGIYLRGTNVLGSNISTTAGHFKGIGIAGSSTGEGLSFLSGGNLTIDNVSVKLLAGNHATQATSAQRPTYGIHPYSGVRNVANGSAAYDNTTYWPASSVASGITVTRTAGSDATGPYIDIRYAGTATGGGTDITFQYAPSRRAASVGDVYTCSAIVQRVAGVAANSSMSVSVAQEIAPSTYSGGTDSAVTTSATPVTISATHTVTAGNQVRPGVGFGFIVGTTIDVTYRIRDLQFEKSATRTAYQANFSQYNITEAGVPSVHYIGFDGVDDNMKTSALTPNTDKVQIFVGLHKPSDAARGIILESLQLPAVLGTATIQVPAPGAFSYNFTSRGVFGQGADIAGFPAPITSVFTALGDIAASRMEARINGNIAAVQLNDQGGGNYLNYPIYVASRGGTSIFFNGRLYQIIVRFGPNLTTGQITSTETFVNGKTGAY